MEEIRNTKYWQLVTSGFSGKQASRFRDFKQDLVNQLCEMMLEAKILHDEIDQKITERINNLLIQNGKRL